MRLPFLLCLALAACSSDPAPPADSGPADTGMVDTGWPWTDAVDVIADDRMALPDFGPRDTGADVVAVADVPAADVVDATVADAGADVVAVADAGSDVPADVRINCAVPGAPDIACSSHADCARCIPGAFNSIWCCRANGSCGNTSNPTCN